MASSSTALSAIVSRYGAAATAKLTRKGVSGQPEEQLRAPLEQLAIDVAQSLGFPAADLVVVGETAVADLKTRPDFAITRRHALIGFIELKAPGKGADPRKFTDKHDKEQWDKLKSLPNLIYTDGDSFSLWRSGELEGEIVRLEGTVDSSGAALAAPQSLLRLFSDFLRWNPIPPSSAMQLAEVSAKLCRLLRDEVVEQMALGSTALTNLAKDWRKLLFPGASDSEFADGYAQAVTFGLLMARSQGIPVTGDLDGIAKALARTNSLIGSAFRLLTDDASNQEALKTSLATLTRVLGVVEWAAISKGSPDAWLYFYEHFLTAYDNDLRKRTGSYYTPPQIVTAMVRMVDELLRDGRRFAVLEGLASQDVTLADPAVGTGTFLLGVLRRIADTTALDQGPGAVPGVIRSSLRRIIGFELQFGPFAVAQLRLLAEVADLLKSTKVHPDDVHLRLYVTDTLGNPDEEHDWIPNILRPLAESRRAANAIKRAEPITVVIGNPPYKEKAKGVGGWVESGSANIEAPLSAWMPPRGWGVSAHAKHLRNLYVYFWRWASWKVFGDGASNPADRKGIVCFITVAGFLNGPGFQKMRAELRRDADEIWVIDCSPEGHQPEVATRVFQGVQQPVCIVLAARLANCDPEVPARVRFRSLPEGRREQKFQAISEVSLQSDDWIECPNDWRAPFLPGARGAWADFPSLEDCFIYHGSGVMPGRTWVIAPDTHSLQRRWMQLINEPDSAQKERLFHPHLRDKKPGDKHINKIVSEGLPGHAHRSETIANDTGPLIPPVRYGFRSFDRQWIIPDARLINQPNPTLWDAHSGKQVYLTALMQHAPRSGPAVTFTALIPDLHHYKGSFGGRAFPLWTNAEADRPNVQPALLTDLSSAYGRCVSAEDMLAYIAAVAAHPAFTKRFEADLVQPGLRIPITADAKLFEEAVRLGREVIWLHTFGERFADPAEGRPSSVPRLPRGEGPFIPRDGEIPSAANEMPNAISYDGIKRRLTIGAGFIENVSPDVWNYEVSGTQVVTQWFSYRRRDRSRPIIGDRRPPSPLGEIQPEGWLSEYTTELLNVLHLLGRLVALEPAQADLLDRICAGPLIGADKLRAAISTPGLESRRRSGRKRDRRQMTLLGDK